MSFPYNTYNYYSAVEQAPHQFQHPRVSSSQPYQGQSNSLLALIPGISPSYDYRYRYERDKDEKDKAGMSQPLSAMPLGQSQLNQPINQVSIGPSGQPLAQPLQMGSGLMNQNDNSISSQPISGQSISSQPISGQSISSQPISSQSISSQPISNQSISNQSISNSSQLSNSNQSISSQPINQHGSGLSIHEAPSRLHPLFQMPYEHHIDVPMMPIPHPSLPYYSQYYPSQEWEENLYQGGEELYEYTQYPYTGYVPQPQNFSRPAFKYKSEPVLTPPSALPSVVGHFKPIQTKKNSKPRIHKIYKARRRSSSSIAFAGELSMDEYRHSFAQTLRLDTNKRCDLFRSSYEFELYTTFVMQIAPNLDLFMGQDIFSSVVAPLALYDDTRILFSAVCVLSVFVHSQNRPTAPKSPIEYYQETINLINQHVDNKQHMARCLVATTLLCVYELCFVNVESVHIQSAIALLKQQSDIDGGISLVHNTFYRSFAWTLFICDSISSTNLNQPNYFSYTAWKNLDPEYFHNFSLYPPSIENPNKEHVLWWYYKSVVLLSLANELKNTTTVNSKDHTEKQQSDWAELDRSVREFDANMPASLKPSIYKQGDPVPTIYFSNELTALIAVNYRLCMIILHDSNADFDLTRRRLALEILGILKTYNANLSMWFVNLHISRRVGGYLVSEPYLFEQCKNLYESTMVSFNVR